LRGGILPGATTIDKRLADDEAREHRGREQGYHVEGDNDASQASRKGVIVDIDTHYEDE